MSQKSPGFAFANNIVNNPDAINTSFGAPPKPVETRANPPTARTTMQFTTPAPENRPDLNMSRGTMFREQGVDVGNQYSDANRQEKIQTPSTRPEMRGPSTDIDNILSGLKTKTVNIHEQATQREDDSMISISSLKDMQNGNMPKKSNRRNNRSDKNVVSLDI
jgi:hypothetical protein